MLDSIIAQLEVNLGGLQKFVHRDDILGSTHLQELYEALKKLKAYKMRLNLALYEEERRLIIDREYGL